MRRYRPRWSSGLFTAAVVLCLASPPTHGEHHRRVRGQKSKPQKSKPHNSSSEAQQAEELVQQGVSALAARDLTAAAAALTQAYRLRPGPETLYQLGMLAQAEGRALDAQDLMQRYLADPHLESAPDSAEQKEALRVVAKERPGHARLNVLGDRGTLVSLDGRLVGVLPLARPLLMSPTEHRLTLASADSQQEETVQVPVGRVGELRYTRAAGAVVMTVLPIVLLVGELTSMSQMMKESLESTIEGALQDEHLSVLPARQALDAAGTRSLSTCLATTQCQVELARKCEAGYVLRLRATTPDAPDAVQLSLELIDVGVGELAARRERSCPACAPAQLRSALIETTSALLLAAQSRPRGILMVESSPPGAEVRSGDRILGITPYQQPAWAGERELTLTLQGYDSQWHRILIFDRRTATLKVELVATVPAPAWGPLRELRSAPDSPQLLGRLAKGPGGQGASERSWKE